MARLAALLSLIAVIVWQGAPAAFTDQLLDAGPVALVHASVLVALLAAGLVLAAGDELILPAGWTWWLGAAGTFAALAGRIWCEHPVFVGPASYLALQSFFFFLLVPQLLSRDRALALAGCVLVSSTALAIGSLCSRWLAPAAPAPPVPDSHWHQRMGFGWPSGNPNLTALLLAPGVLLALGLAIGCWSRASRGARLTLALIALSNLTALLVTGSMGAVVGLTLGGVWLLWVLRRRWLVVGLAVGAVALLLLLLLPGAARLRGRVGASASASIQLRLLLAQQAIGCWSAAEGPPPRRWLGTGLGGYPAAAIPHRPDAYAVQPQRAAISPHPHNRYLLLLVERGLLGLLLHLALLGALAARALALARDDDPLLALQGAVAGAVVLALSTHALFTPWVDHPLGRYAWWGWAGALAATLKRPARDGQPSAAAGPLLGAIFALPPAVLLMTVFAPFVLSPLQAARVARQAAQLEREAGRLASPIRARRRQQDAVARWGEAVRRAAARGETMRSLAIRERWVQATARLGRSGRAAAIERLAQLRQLCPGYGISGWRMASLLAMEQAWERAAPAYEQAVAEQPFEAAIFREWWRQRERLTDAAHRRRMLAALDRAAELFEGAGDPRFLEVDTLRRRLRLELAAGR